MVWARSALNSKCFRVWNRNALSGLAEVENFPFLSPSPYDFLLNSLHATSEGRSRAGEVGFRSGCARTPADLGQARPKRGYDTPERGVIAAVPKEFAAWRMLNARIESAASAFSALTRLA
jgi:hypothetical protein